MTCYYKMQQTETRDYLPTTSSSQLPELLMLGQCLNISNQMCKPEVQTGRDGEPGDDGLPAIKPGCCSVWQIVLPNMAM